MKKKTTSPAAKTRRLITEEAEARRCGMAAVAPLDALAWPTPKTAAGMAQLIDALRTQLRQARRRLAAAEAEAARERYLSAGYLLDIANERVARLDAQENQL